MGQKRDFEGEGGEIMNDKEEIREDNACIRSDINVLEMMVKGYEEQGGGYSQKEALNTAIKWLKQLIAIKGSGVLPEKKERGDIPNYSQEIVWNEAIDVISLRLAKALSGLEREIEKVLDTFTYVTGKSSPDKLIWRKETRDVIAKGITTHIKTKLGLGEVK